MGSFFHQTLQSLRALVVQPHMLAEKGVRKSFKAVFVL
jgi:hypothetical protein